MISDEQDEDADILDDETQLETYFGTVAPKRVAGTDGAACMADWPPLRERDLGLNLDAETLSWFKARHVDWRSGMAGVLRAWVAVQTRPPQNPKTTPNSVDARPCETQAAPDDAGPET
jgi:uncharacterized protein (DUF4415 family)